MNVKKGLVVRAVAGRDKDCAYFVVTECDEKYAMIADGKSRKLLNPKRKNLKHLRATSKTLDIDAITDKQLRRALGEFKKLTPTESGGEKIV